MMFARRYSGSTAAFTTAVVDFQGPAQREDIYGEKGEMNLDP